MTDGWNIEAQLSETNEQAAARHKEMYEALTGVNISKMQSQLQAAATVIDEKEARIKEAEDLSWNNWRDREEAYAEMRVTREELAAVKTRIRELEQERGAEGTNWFPESFVSQLQAQLQAVTQERDTAQDAQEPLLLLRARDHHALSAIDAYQQACESDCSELHAAGIQQVREKFCQFQAKHPERMKQSGVTRHLKLEPDSQLAQLQAHNKAMRDALKEAKPILEAQWLANGIHKKPRLLFLIDAALALTQEKPGG